jgi:hypothetical protein
VRRSFAFPCILLQGRPCPASPTRTCPWWTATRARGGATSSIPMTRARAAAPDVSARDREGRRARAMRMERAWVEAGARWRKRWAGGRWGRTRPGRFSQIKRQSGLRPGACAARQRERRKGGRGQVNPVAAPRSGVNSSGPPLAHSKRTHPFLSSTRVSPTVPSRLRTRRLRPSLPLTQHTPRKHTNHHHARRHRKRRGDRPAAVCRRRQARGRPSPGLRLPVHPAHRPPHPGEGSILHAAAGRCQPGTRWRGEEGRARERKNLVGLLRIGARAFWLFAGSPAGLGHRALCAP